MIYLSIFIFILYFVYKYDIHKDKGYKDSVFWCICISFILLAGLRYRIGGDTCGYMESWDMYPDIWNFNWLEDIEKNKNMYPNMKRYQIGWILYTMFFLGICKHQVLMQFSVAILLNFAIFRTIKKYSSYPFITIFVFFFNFKFFEFEFEIMRESVAVAVFLLFAFDNYIKKKWIKYYIGTFLAFMIHTSAIVMFVLPLFRSMKVSVLKGSLLFMVIPISISIFGRIILGDLLNIFLNPEGHTASYMMSAVAKDYNSNYIIMYIFQPIVLYVLVVSLYSHVKNTLYAPLIFFTLFFLDLSILYYTSSRLVNYIIIPVYIGITPLLCHLIKKYKTILVLPILLFVYNTPSILEYQSSPEWGARYFPYQNYIFQERSPLQKKIDQFGRDN